MQENSDEMGKNREKTYKKDEIRTKTSKYKIDLQDL